MVASGLSADAAAALRRELEAAGARVDAEDRAMSFLRRLLGRDDEVADNGLPAVPRSSTPRSGELTLLDAGPKKIHVIKIVREATGVGLAEAKDLVDHTPTVLDAELGPDSSAPERSCSITRAGHHGRRPSRWSARRSSSPTSARRRSR